MSWVYCYRSMDWRACSKTKNNLFGSAETNNVLGLKLHFQSETIHFLKKTRIDLQMGVYVIYHKSINTLHKNISILTGPGHDKVTEMRRTFRSACVELFIRNLIFLGGSVIICQIDERSFFHKQKYHGGRTPEHQV
ncbi:hypothetical protein AAJ76_85000106 [Vairimorpha ceranae]|uniref:Uncharacterized protein n=1 Tax=Vairimorpha ceranae TaxID=40302 RepID=A0A0F9WBP2_9MICR|nr:hypothetical protein AAJ76_85000106 [Vairimorpha ceranae]KKO74300.1 hypothetical protein AAJ76_85000106 [Vairimorpha ceranae]